MATKKDIKKEIIKVYTNSILSQEKPFHSVYELCSKIQIEESDFYQYFSSLETIESEILKELIHSSLEVLKKSEEYTTYDSKSKLLSFYFTFFDTLTLNRSIFLKLIHANNKVEKLKKIGELKAPFLNFVKELEINFASFSSDKIHQIQEKTIEFTAWSQFLVILKFWIEDTSKGFEKTDIFIEKSIHTSFKLIQSNTLESIVDLGKFIWKEKIQKVKA